MVFKHSGRRIFLLATDTFMNSRVKPLLWITECFIVSKKEVNLFEIWVFRKFASLVECSHRGEQSGVTGASTLGRLWKVKERSTCSRIRQSHSERQPNRSGGCFAGAVSEAWYRRPDSSPARLPRSNRPLVHLLPMPSPKPLAKYRMA